MGLSMARAPRGAKTKIESNVHIDVAIVDSSSAFVGRCNHFG
jgi:hypothetical protein